MYWEDMCYKDCMKCLWVKEPKTPRLLWGSLEEKVSIYKWMGEWYFSIGIKTTKLIYFRNNMSNLDTKLCL